MKQKKRKKLKFKKLSDGVLIALLMGALIEVWYWGPTGFLGQFSAPAIEATNAAGFTWGSAVIMGIMFAVGINVIAFTALGGRCGQILVQRHLK